MFIRKKKKKKKIAKIVDIARHTNIINTCVGFFASTHLKKYSFHRLTQYVNSSVSSNNTWAAT